MNKMKQDKNEPYLEFTVTEEMGLLAFLLQTFPNKGRNHTKSLLVHKQTFVDGKMITKHDYPLRIGQKVKILKSGKSAPAKKQILKIMYEDNDMIVINKQAGLLSVATDKKETMTAYHLLTDYVRQSNPHGRIFIVHRLDRDTSGVFMVAKNEPMKLALQQNWEAIVSHRGYMAVVSGRPKQSNGTVKSWLRETVTHLMYSSYTPDDGLLAITNYNLLKQNEEYALLEVNIETGRKNQIRVHMKDLGCPVVGDKKYGTTKDPLKRLGLHAHKLSFRHPLTGKELSFEAQIPVSFTDLFK